MRERFDFSSISRIILENRKAESFSYSEYYYTLFSYAFIQQDIKISEPDQANINKIINGERNVPKDIINLYEESENYKQLERGVIEVLKDVADPAYIKEQLLNLLWNDPTISKDKKEGVSESKDNLVEFIAYCIQFGIIRNFIARNKKDGEPCKKKSFLISDYLLDYHFPSVNKVFLGRENDLNEIHKQLSETSCLFLEGIGGIGKSELAKQYGKLYKDEYEHILFIRYKENLRKTIIELAFVDDTSKMSDDDLFYNHYRFFKQLNVKTLVILDNFDTVAEKEELFHDFLAMPFQLLVTTRSHIEETSCYLIREIESTEELLQLFYAYAPASQNNPNITLAIIEEVYRHTLTVEMAAKTLIASDISLEELLLALRKEGIALSNPNKVKVVKDNKSKKERLHKHIQTLFTLQNLSDMSQYTLMNTVLIPESGISKRLFHKWMQTEDFNIVNELIDYGWIQQDSENNRISLHPFLREVIGDFTKPSITKCAVFIKGIFEVCLWFGIDVSYYRDVLNSIESIFEHVKIDDAQSAYFLLDRTIAYLGKYEEFDKMDRLLKIMKEILPENETYKIQRANYELYKGVVESGRRNQQLGIEHLKRGIEILQPMHPIYASILANLYNNLGNCYLATNDKNKMIICREICVELIEEYMLPNNHDAFIQKTNLALGYIIIKKYNEAENILIELIKTGEQISDFGMTISLVYIGMATLKAESSPKEARKYFEKAKKSRISHLGAEHPEIKAIDSQIEKLNAQIRLRHRLGYR